MSKALKAVKSFFKPTMPKMPSLPEKEKPVPLPQTDDIQARQAVQRERAEASMRSGRDSTMLSEQRLGDQGSPMMRSGLAGSSVVTG